MVDERTFVFDFIVSNITFNDPNEYKLTDIAVNVSFLEAKLVLNTTNELEFREGRSLEFRSTQEDLKDSLGVSSIKVYIQKKDEDNRYTTLDSYIIDWNYRLFEKLENDNFRDYSQLEHQDIVHNDIVIGNVIMGFQINAKEEHLKFVDIDDKKSDLSQRTTTRTDLSIGDSLKDNYHTSKESVQRDNNCPTSKESMENDLLFFIGEETNSLSKIPNTSKTYSHVPFDGPISLKSFKAYQKKCRQHGNHSAIEIKDSEFSNASEIGDSENSKHSNIAINKKFDPMQRLDMTSSVLNQFPHKKRSSRFNVRKSHSNINLKLLNRYVAGGKLNQCENFELPDEEQSLECDYNIGNCESAIRNLTCNDNNINSKCINKNSCNKNTLEFNFEDYQNSSKSCGEDSKKKSCKMYSSDFNAENYDSSLRNQMSCNQHGTDTAGSFSTSISPQKAFKCKNSAVNRILDEYDTQGDSGGGGVGTSMPHLSQILSALKSKYGNDIASTPKLEALKCLPEDLEKQSNDISSRFSHSCKSKSDKGSYKFKIPLCLTRKTGTSHGKCQRKTVGVPKHMGWLWNVDKEMVAKGWRPGAISTKIKNLMNHFLKDFPADTLPVFRRDRKIKTNRDQLIQKPTLKLKKCNGIYSIVMRPLKNPEDIACSADPYLKMRPIRFTIKKLSADDCCCNDDESDGEFDVEFTPPAGLIKPKLLNRPVIACKETQYSEADYIIKTSYEPPARKKYDKIPAFCKDFVKEYNMANRPPCKPEKKKKGGKGGGAAKPKGKGKK